MEIIFIDYLKTEPT